MAYVRYGQADDLRRDHSQGEHRQEEQTKSPDEHLLDERVQFKFAVGKDGPAEQDEDGCPAGQDEGSGQTGSRVPGRSGSVRAVGEDSAGEVAQGRAGEHDADDAGPGEERHAEFLGDDARRRQFQRHPAEAGEKHHRERLLNVVEGKRVRGLRRAGSVSDRSDLCRRRRTQHDEHDGRQHEERPSCEVDQRVDRVFGNEVEAGHVVSEQAAERTQGEDHSRDAAGAGDIRQVEFDRERSQQTQHEPGR